ncbi:hypothetical protein C0J52_08793 [Blattella germanica]|nr:hypothetical protein C0J52_08793 [Blattella germanica]
MFDVFLSHMLTNYYVIDKSLSLSCVSRTPPDAVSEGTLPNNKFRKQPIAVCDVQRAMELCGSLTVSCGNHILTVRMLLLVFYLFILGNQQEYNYHLLLLLLFLLLQP